MFRASRVGPSSGQVRGMGRLNALEPGGRRGYPCKFLALASATWPARVMSESPIDHEHLEITGKHKTLPKGSSVKVEDADRVKIVITQAYGPNGDQLVGISDQAFDGYPALTLLVRGDGLEGEVHLSPIHGDDRKTGLTDIPVGTKLELLCPVSKRPLEIVESIEGDVDGDYCALYLTKSLSKGSMILVSNVWGHYHSRVVDEFELISYWASRHEELDGA